MQEINCHSPFSASSSAATAIASPRDIVDAPSTSSSVYHSLKQRTVSITSVNEEDDESASLLSERCRYISVSEEDELRAAGGTATETAAAPDSATVTTVASDTVTTTTTAAASAPAATPSPSPAVMAATQAQSVITEQPTASSKLKLDLLLASADIITQPTTQQQTLEQEPLDEVKSLQPVANSNPNPNQTTPIEDPQPEPITIYVPQNPQETPAITSSASILASLDAEPIISTAEMLPMSIGTTAISEDSDEYRSLEGKDDGDADDFPISE